MTSALECVSNEQKVMSYRESLPDKLLIHEVKGDLPRSFGSTVSQFHTQKPIEKRAVATAIQKH